MRRSPFCGTAGRHPGRLWVLVTLMWSVSWVSSGQGTLKVYDQVINYGMPDPYDGHSGFPLVRTNAPFAQSIVPALGEVGFVELAFRYRLSSDLGLSETLYLNLREGSATGPILGSTTPVLFAYASGDPGWGRTHIQDFLFPEAAGLDPGEKYFIEVVHVSGDDLIGVALVCPNYAGEPTYYPSGELVRGGWTFRGWDMWFREGVLIPEPGTASLLGLGAALLVWRSCCRRTRSP